MSATPSEITAATARRNEIVNLLLEFFTGDSTFSTKELQHYRAVASIFAIEPVVKELTGTASTRENRTELALSVAMCALSIAMDDSPPTPSQRVLKRREADLERREAAKEFKAAVAFAKPAGAVVATAKPVRSVKELSRTGKYYHAIRSRMSPEELAADRAKRAEVMRRFRANRKAKKARNAVNGL
jgi:hypothetical protein